MVLREAFHPGRTEGIEAATAVPITGLGTALPQHRVGGAELLSALADVWPNLGRRVRRLGEELDRGSRYLVRSPSDFMHPVPLDEQRSRYIHEATDLAVGAARAAMTASGVRAGDIALLVVSSCTGFVLPGVDVRLVERLGISDDVRRLPLAHFGCAGGAAGLAHAAEWVRRTSEGSALVVAVEVPSITFRPGDRSTDNLLSAMVFGDGAAAAVLAPKPSAPGNLRIGRTQSHLVPGTRAALGFEVLSDGFRVIVSRRLPELIEKHLAPLVDSFLQMPASELEAVAVHPGGRAIVDAVSSCLQL
ncbi:MAG: hypothetical protein JOY68_01545, partial [Candidatus Dormibacteraeota bacterium]|nr:hypothetical protein [Candidatus Dormibacteraeota bacterium]